MTLRSCVSPAGGFVYGLHRPGFTSDNFRARDALADLGRLPDGSHYRNTANFPAGPVHAPAADPIFEIPNAFPFRGTTYIGKVWADATAETPDAIRLPRPPAVSFSSAYPEAASARQAIANLPRPLKLALATTSTDPRDLRALAHQSCKLRIDATGGTPGGLTYEQHPQGGVRPNIADRALFEAVANNPRLPDDYKQAMVLRPGVQGGSEIVGEWGPHGTSHVFEYLRCNSYIPWGHYAANMANDAVRYDTASLCRSDMTGMRHLYYQRTYARLARLLQTGTVPHRRPLGEDELETLRTGICRSLANGVPLSFDRTLWGWNFGFDYAPSGYRMHASHQQVHQQYALIPGTVPDATAEGSLPAFGYGDLVADFVATYRRETGKSFFGCYERAIRENRRMDGDDRRDRHLVVFEDERVMLFVPKAQTSQWELQLMPKDPVGNIVEADTAMRRSLDQAMLVAIKVLGALGARMVSTIEVPKAITDAGTDQRLLMIFLPKLPESPGAFSEAQLRWINGHYPEDFALACRRQLPHVVATG